MLELPVRDCGCGGEGLEKSPISGLFLELTRHEFCRMAGMSFRDMHARGIDPVLSKITVEYKSPLRSGDVMVSKLDIARRGPLFVFHQDIYKKDGTPVVFSKVSVATLENGRLSRGDVLADAFRKYIGE